MVERVTINDQETGPDAPEETTAPVEEQTEAPVEQEEAPAIERPDWLPNKFESSEELAKAYGQLEKKFSSQQAEEKGLITPDDLSKYEDEYLNGGSLEEGSYTELAKRGVSRELVDSFIQGRELQAQKMEGEMYQLTGGKEGYQAMSKWMTDHLSSDQIEGYNDALGHGGAIPELAIKGMYATFLQAGGDPGSSAPNLIQGGKADSIGGYGSQAEMMADMKNPLYQAGDVNYHNMVEKRISQTSGNVM
jgi:hypothetical protein